MPQSKNVLRSIAAAAGATSTRLRSKPPLEPPKVSFTDTSEGGTEDMTPRNEELETGGHEYPVGEPTVRSARARVNKLVLPAPSKPRMGPLLVACITACNESYEELQYCMATFHGRCPPDLNLGMVYVFLDACPDQGMQETNDTFKALVDLLALEVPSSGACMLEGGCRVYRGTLGYIQARLYVKGRGDFQRSKRRSVTAFYSILAERIAAGVSEEPVAVLHMDGDTGSATLNRDNAESSYGLETVGKMMRIMEGSSKLGAIASQVRVLTRTRNILTLMQSFDCSTTYVGVFGGSSLIGRSIACFGMAVMYRYRALLKSNVKDVQPPLQAFSRTPGKNLVDLVNLDMNEDQGMTTFIMRAGYDTKVSVVTRFYTFAPETLAELMGQRRRWQAGYFVGMPSQVFGYPSPHLQSKKYRWLMAFVVMSMWTNAFLLPGTVGVGLALIFGQAYEGYVVKGDEMETGTAVPVECRFQEAMFAVGVWVFWLIFIMATIDRAPKHIRNRCRFFFGTACIVSVSLCLAAAAVSEGVQIFVILAIVLNLSVGLALTYDVKEWPHRLQEIILYVIFLYAVQPMITMYSVANIDSALWGTRSVGDVNATAKALDSTTPPPEAQPIITRGVPPRPRRRRGRPVIAPVAMVGGSGSCGERSLESEVGNDEVDVVSPPQSFAGVVLGDTCGRLHFGVAPEDVADDAGGVGFTDDEDMEGSVMSDFQAEREEIGEAPRSRMPPQHPWNRYLLAVPPVPRLEGSQEAGGMHRYALRSGGRTSPAVAPSPLPPPCTTQGHRRYRWSRYRLAVAPAVGEADAGDLDEEDGIPSDEEESAGQVGCTGAAGRPVSLTLDAVRSRARCEEGRGGASVGGGGLDRFTEGDVRWRGEPGRVTGGAGLPSSAVKTKRRRRCCGLSLRKRKFIVLALWVTVNMGVTVTFLLWRLYLVVVLNFFSNFAGLVTIVVTARIEAFRQRRSSHAPPPDGNPRDRQASGRLKRPQGTVNASDASSVTTLVSKWESSASTEMV